MPKNKKKRKSTELHARRQMIRFEQACGDSSDGGDDIGVAHSSSGSVDNIEYERAYRGSVVPEDHWKKFVDSMRRPLPVTIRLEADTVSGDFLRRRLDSSGGQGGGAGYAAAKFNIGGLDGAIELPFDKHSLRKNPTLRALHSTLAREMILGTLSRQELVSMLPAWLAGVQPGYRCFELCCCPGSKSRQILSMLRGSSGESRRGLLVANDSDAKRTANLAKQFQASSASSGGDPKLIVANALGDDLCHEIARAAAANPELLLFDRVFVDVPCSGDGTFRKAPDLWRRWTPDAGAALAPLQTQLLSAALEACAPGGIVAYSTCSLNPVENEGVVKAVLRSLNKQGLGEAVELLDGHARARKHGCHFFLRPGLSSTKKQDRDLHLERCVRVLPHDNNTGGFFVALLQKIDTPVPVRGVALDVLTPQQSLAALQAAGFDQAARPKRDTVPSSAVNTEVRRDLSSEERELLLNMLGLSVSADDDSCLLAEEVSSLDESSVVRILLASSEAAKMSKAFTHVQTVVAIGVEVARISDGLPALTPTCTVLPFLASANILSTSLHDMSSLGIHALEIIESMEKEAFSSANEAIGSEDEGAEESMKRSNIRRSEAAKLVFDDNSVVEVKISKALLPSCIRDAICSSLGSQNTAEIILKAISTDNTDENNIQTSSSKDGDSSKAASSEIEGPPASSVSKRPLSKAERKRLKKSKEDHPVPLSDSPSSPAALAAPAKATMPFVLVLGFHATDAEAVLLRCPSSSYLRRMIEYARGGRKAFW
jgi:16S rRNA C967 or C1407 C5-methylase (RsmB/RsmF family)